MRFKNRSYFASYLYDRVITPEMNQKERLQAAILVGSYCSQIPEGATITIKDD